MTKTINHKDAEKQVFRLATFDDGIWEIYLGLFFTLMSAYSVTRELLGPAVNAVFILGMAFLLVGVGWIAKRRFTLPRTGLVRLGQPTKRKIRHANLITLMGALVLSKFLRDYPISREESVNAG